jgi:formate hydrogenlyase subunit 4
MVMISALLVQACQMALVVLLAPLLTGLVRKVKARLLRRQGPSLIQPYRDLLRLFRKEAVVAQNASWLFRVVPYLIFATTWVAAAVIPTFAKGLIFSWTADLIAIIALLGSARFFLALAGMDVGTSFGGIGSSREAMIATLAEPSMLLIIFDTAFDHCRVHELARRGFAGLAGDCPRCPRHGRACRKRPYSGRQSGDPSGTDHGA